MHSHLDNKVVAAAQNADGIGRQFVLKPGIATLSSLEQVYIAGASSLRVTRDSSWLVS